MQGDAWLPREKAGIPGGGSWQVLADTCFPCQGIRGVYSKEGTGRGVGAACTSGARRAWFHAGMRMGELFLLGWGWDSELDSDRMGQSLGLHLLRLIPVL